MPEVGVRPADFGPIYLETNLSRFPVEPFNTYSNLCFLALVLYFAYRTKFSLKDHPLTVSALPILLLGFVGGTIYHATRSHSIWLVLDFVPIAVLSLMAAAYLWHKITRRWILTVLLMVGLVVFPRAFIWTLDFPRSLKITTGYGILALSIILPAIIHCKKQRWKSISLLLLTFVSFSIALFFRWFDQNGAAEHLPMGSHFLWHLFGAVSTAGMMSYLFGVEELTLREIENTVINHSRPSGPVVPH